MSSHPSSYHQQPFPSVQTQIAQSAVISIPQPQTESAQAGVGLNMAARAMPTINKARIVGRYFIEGNPAPKIRKCQAMFGIILYVCRLSVRAAGHGGARAAAGRTAGDRFAPGARNAGAGGAAGGGVGRGAERPGAGNYRRDAEDAEIPRRKQELEARG